MQVFDNEKKLLGMSLFVIVGIFFVANFLNQENNSPLVGDIYPTDVLFIIIPVIAIIFGGILSLIYRGSGYIGKAWILFTISMLIWLVGETTFEYEYNYDIENISSMTSDIFYILGYPIFFAFTILYLKPVKKSITKNMVIIAFAISIMFVIPTLFLTLEEEGLDSLTMFFYAIYPILDGLILGPSIIAVMLFFRGQVNFLWTLVLIATLSDIAADTSYMIFAVEDSYYPGHPVDILYLFSYTLIAFGAYSHIKLYKKPSRKNTKDTNVT